MYTTFRAQHKQKYSFLRKHSHLLNKEMNDKNHCWKSNIHKYIVLYYLLKFVVFVPSLFIGRYRVNQHHVTHSTREQNTKTSVSHNFL